MMENTFFYRGYKIDAGDNNRLFCALSGFIERKISADTIEEMKRKIDEEIEDIQVFNSTLKKVEIFSTITVIMLVMMLLWFCI